MFIIFTSPKPGGDQKSMGIDHMCVCVCVYAYVCVYVWNVNVSQS